MQLLEAFKNNRVDIETGRRKPDPAFPYLLMIHGAGGNARTYLPQLSGIKNANTFSISLPGHGGTPGPGRESISDYATWLSGLLEQGGRKAILMGHSMGGAIALQCALNFPGLVRALVLIGTGARLRVFPSILQGIRQDFSRTVGEIIRFAYAENTNPQWLAAGATEMSAVGPDVLCGDFTACDGFDLVQALDKISCPVQLIYGDQDRLTPPKYGRFLADKLPNASLEVLPGAGHMVFVEKAPETNRLINEFCLRL